MQGENRDGYRFTRGFIFKEDELIAWPKLGKDGKVEEVFAIPFNDTQLKDLRDAGSTRIKVGSAIFSLSRSKIRKHAQRVIYLNTIPTRE